MEREYYMYCCGLKKSKWQWWSLVNPVVLAVAFLALLQISFAPVILLHTKKI